jgi:uncharacterized membrane protein YGL010W
MDCQQSPGLHVWSGEETDPKTGHRANADEVEANLRTKEAQIAPGARFERGEGPGMSRFDWVRRMGVHEAYHLSRTNRIIHWICIPLQLFAVVWLLSLVRLGPIDLAVPAILAAGAVFVAADFLVGVLMTMALAGFWLFAHQLAAGSLALDAGLAAGLFGAALLFQTQVGHGHYEQGVDDTAKNLAELRRTKNPIPILLVFAYHLVEILFALGYRRDLKREVEDEREAERRRIPDDPRRRHLSVKRRRSVG